MRGVEVEDVQGEWVTIGPFKQQQQKSAGELTLLKTFESMVKLYTKVNWEW